MNSTDTAIRKGYHTFANIIRSLKLPRAKQCVLLAILALCPNGELTTERFPVIVDKIAEYAGYSKAHAFDTMRELEDAGVLERERRKIRLADGTVRNLPTTYRLILPGVEQKRPVNASSSKNRPLAQPIATEPVNVDVDDLDADYESSQQEPTSGVDAPWLGDGCISSVYPPIASIPAPESSPDPNTHPLAAQSPQGFADEEQEMGDAIARRAQEKLQPMVAQKATRAQATAAWSTIVAARYTIGRFAFDACVQYRIAEKEIIACVDEWIVKCVARFYGLTRQQLALRLRRFFHDKGCAIVKMRNSDQFGLKMLA